MPTTSFHEAATRCAGKVIVAVGDVAPDFKTNGVAVLLDLERRCLRSEFPVRYEAIGGPRLALSRDDALCFAGCYDAYGIAAYATSDGSEVWRRKDLKSVQRVELLESLNVLFCGRETGAAHLLNPETGQSAQKLAGVDAMFGSPFDDSVVVSGKRSLALHRPFGKRVQAVSHDDYVRKCAFSPARVAILDFKSLRCFDLGSGELVWARPSSEDAPYKHLCWCPGLGCFIANQRKQNGGSFVFIHPDRWEIAREVPHGFVGEGEFCLNGAAWFQGNMCLSSTATGERLHDFTTGPMLQRDPRHKRALLAAQAFNSITIQAMEDYMKTADFSPIEIQAAVFARQARKAGLDKPSSPPSAQSSASKAISAN